MISADRHSTLRRRRRVVGGVVPELMLIAVLAGCMQAQPSPTPVATEPVESSSSRDPCDQARADFMTAASAYNPSAASARQSAVTVSPAADSIAVLRQDAETADDALARLVGTFGTLAACRADHLLPAELISARGALTMATVMQQKLAGRLQQLLAGSPATTRAAVSVSLASLSTELPYLAIDAAEIYDRPDNKRRPIAALRKGQRLTSPSLAAEAESKPGWIAIDLNDGSTGYVSSSALKPLATVPAVHSSGEATGAAIAIEIITEALPAKRDALQARLNGDDTIAKDGS